MNSDMIQLANILIEYEELKSDFQYYIDLLPIRRQSLEMMKRDQKVSSRQITRAISEIQDIRFSFTQRATKLQEHGIKSQLINNVLATMKKPLNQAEVDNLKSAAPKEERANK